MVKEIKDTPTGSDAKGAIEDEVERIPDILGSEVLGYPGEAHEEHTGEAGATDESEDEPHLADNAPEQVRVGILED
jgi:hypothetical protein